MSVIGERIGRWTICMSDTEAFCFWCLCDCGTYQSIAIGDLLALANSGRQHAGCDLCTGVRLVNACGVYMPYEEARVMLGKDPSRGPRAITPYRRTATRVLADLIPAKR